MSLGSLTLDVLVERLGEGYSLHLLNQITVTYAAGRRYATLQLDEDNDIVVLLSDRASDDEAVAWVVDVDAIDSTVTRIRGFLAGGSEDSSCSDV